MVGSNFYYDDKSLKDFGMIMVSPDNEQQFVSREVIRTEQSSIRQIPNHFGAKYNDTLRLSFLIIKNPCKISSQSDLMLSHNDIDILRSWLESPLLPKELIVECDENEDDVYYYGIFEDVQPFLVGSLCAGLHLTFNCTSPYGYSSPITFSTNVSNVTEKMLSCVVNSADTYIPLKPILKVYPTGDIFEHESRLTIINSIDGNTVSFDIPSGIPSIMLDSNTKMVTDGGGNLLPLSKLGWNPVNNEQNSGISYSINWLQLYSGINKLSITKYGDVGKIEINTRFIRKVDGF